MTPVTILFIAIILSGLVVLHQSAARKKSFTESDPGGEPATELHTVRFLKFTPGAFFKLMMLLSGVVGFCYGLFLAIMGLCGGRVRVDFFGLLLHGTEAIVAAPFISPVLGAIGGLLAFLPAWLVTNWLLGRMRGVDLTGVIANVAPEQNTDSQSR